ncbi:MAG: thioredoxin domain-containing protein [Clostridia bacterium]|nr:thioredoxin domain-containing protein [Acidaminococcus fermentans]MDD7220145.1 thioredoxin domain-containing protein [Clostridia bacterium]MDY2851909.1 thioredoxin domain-containing protein [Acidaminococcus fermentans]MDY5554369.1 thioredoxin domain-containing protein [Blautia sp.]
MKIIPLEEKHFQEEVLESEKPVLVDFFADWCHNCEEFIAVMEALAEEMTDVKICMVNTSEAEELSRHNGGVRQCALQGLEIIQVEILSGKELTTPPEVSFELLLVTAVAKRKQRGSRDSY